MSIKFLIILLIFFSIGVTPALVEADVGVGLRWKTESLTLKEFEEKCITYEVYNPFDTAVKGNLEIERSILPFVSKIEPSEFSLPDCSNCANNEMKLANKETITVCFKANPLRWPPFYPIEYEGVVLAKALPTGIPDMGSATASVVQAPLSLKIGSMGDFYIFVVVMCILIALAVLAVLKLKRKLPVAKKWHCSKCKKLYRRRMKYCPNCGRRLKEV